VQTPHFFLTSFSFDACFRPPLAGRLLIEASARRKFGLRFRSSGFEVDHPTALVVRDGVAVFLAPGGVPVWFDHESVDPIIGVPANSAP
jgi:hypothetical protein